MNQFCNQTKSNAELQGRVEPTYHDLASALIELGIDLNSFFKYIRTINTRIPKNKIAKRNLIDAFHFNLVN